MHAGLAESTTPDVSGSINSDEILVAMCECTQEDRIIRLRSRLSSYERERDDLYRLLRRKELPRRITRENRLRILQATLIPNLERALERNHGFAESPRLEPDSASA